MNLKPGQKLLLNGVTVTVGESGDELEITDQEFIQKLIDLGFHEGRNNQPEDLERILKNIPEKYRQAFMDGFHGKLLNTKPQ
jgi:hypothetical protein